jgi:hypothetical protein
MLNILSEDVIAANVSAFVEHVTGVTTDTPTRHDYFDALNGVQSMTLPAAPDRPELPWTMTFAPTDDKAVEGLRYAVTDDSGEASEEIELLTAVDVAEVERLMAEALLILRQYDPAVARAAVDLFSWFIFARKDGVIGGGAGAELAMMWLNPPTSWTAVDHAESLLHETTHQALFLDHLVNRLFTKSISQMKADPDAHVTSAIRRTRRRFDLSFHAAVVAVELIGLHEHLGLDERAAEHAEGAVTSLEAIATRLDLFTDHGLVVFDHVRGTLTESSAFERSGLTLADTSSVVVT